MNDVLHTKWGNARITDGQYYRITSKKEGHHNKMLHRLIFEDFYGEIPEGHQVHHKNGNKLDNCILNLQLLSVSAHRKLHTSKENHPSIGKHHTEEYKVNKSKQLSEAQSTTRIYRVSKHKHKKTKQGFVWCYYYNENGRRKSIVSVSLKKLKEKVISKGFEWIEFEDCDLNV